MKFAPLVRKIICIHIIAAFGLLSVYVPESRAGEMVKAFMPKPGRMVDLSPSFVPAHLQGMMIHPDNALKFDFLVNRGDEQLDDAQQRIEYKKLIKYFLASLTVPNQDQWVNLSPYEHNRIIADNFGKTEMGRDLLQQDYLLKQITSSLMYPESNLGKGFWAKVYERAWNEFHTTNIPVNTFNKVWIVPDKASVYESNNTVYILGFHLKVMLEEDYLSLDKHAAIGARPKANDPVHTVASKIIRSVILPVLEKEVNEGKNFAQLRQVISGMVLATWYKKALRQSLLGQVYANKAKIIGVNQADTRLNDAIYSQYLSAFKKGVYNYIKEDEDIYTRQSIPRKYFAGGVAALKDVSELNGSNVAGHLGDIRRALAEGTDLAQVAVDLQPEKANAAMNSFLFLLHSHASLVALLPFLVANGWQKSKGRASVNLTEFFKNTPVADGPDGRGSVIAIQRPKDFNIPEERWKNIYRAMIELSSSGKVTYGPEEIKLESDLSKEEMEKALKEFSNDLAMFSADQILDYIAFFVIIVGSAMYFSRQFSENQPSGNDIVIDLNKYFSNNIKVISRNGATHILLEKPKDFEITPRAWRQIKRTVRALLPEMPQNTEDIDFTTNRPVAEVQALIEGASAKGKPFDRNMLGFNRPTGIWTMGAVLIFLGLTVTSDPIVSLNSEAHSLNIWTPPFIGSDIGNGSEVTIREDLKLDRRGIVTFAGQHNGKLIRLNVVRKDDLTNWIGNFLLNYPDRQEIVTDLRVHGYMDLKGEVSPLILSEGPSDQRLAQRTRNSILHFSLIQGNRSYLVDGNEAMLGTVFADTQRGRVIEQALINFVGQERGHSSNLSNVSNGYDVKADGHSGSLVTLSEPADITADMQRMFGVSRAPDGSMRIGLPEMAPQQASDVLRSIFEASQGLSWKSRENGIKEIGLHGIRETIDDKAGTILIKIPNANAAMLTNSQSLVQRIAQKIFGERVDISSHPLAQEMQISISKNMRQHILGYGVVILFALAMVETVLPIKYTTADHVFAVAFMAVLYAVGASFIRSQIMHQRYPSRDFVRGLHDDDGVIYRGKSVPDWELARIISKYSDETNWNQFLLLNAYSGETFVVRLLSRLNNEQLRTIRAIREESGFIGLLKKAAVNKLGAESLTNFNEGLEIIVKKPTITYSVEGAGGKMSDQQAHALAAQTVEALHKILKPAENPTHIVTLSTPYPGMLDDEQMEAARMELVWYFDNNEVQRVAEGVLRFETKLSENEIRARLQHIVRHVGMEYPPLWFANGTVPIFKFSSGATARTGDAAMPGGIDVNADHMNFTDLKQGGKGVSMAFNPKDMAQLGQLTGFDPQILGIQNLKAVPILSELRQKLQESGV